MKSKGTRGHVQRGCVYDCSKADSESNKQFYDISFRNQDSDSQQQTLQEKVAVDYVENELVCFTCGSQKFSILKYIKDGLHQGHEIVRFSQCQEIVNQKCEKLHADIEKRRSELRTKKDYLQNKKKDLMNALKKMRTNVKDQIDYIVFLLGERQKQIIRNAEIIVSAKFELIDHSQQRISKGITELQDISQNLQADQYFSYVQKKRRMDNLSKISTPDIPSFEFDTSYIKVISKQLQNLQSKIAVLKGVDIKNRFALIAFETELSKPPKPQNDKTNLFETPKKSTKLFESADLKTSQSTSIYLAKGGDQHTKASQREYGFEKSSKVTKPHKNNFHRITQINSDKQQFHSETKLRRTSSERILQVHNFISKWNK